MYICISRIIVPFIECECDICYYLLPNVFSEMSGHIRIVLAKWVVHGHSMVQVFPDFLYGAFGAWIKRFISKEVCCMDLKAFSLDRFGHICTSFSQFVVNCCFRDRFHCCQLVDCLQMAVLVETTLGDIVIDVYVKERPKCMSLWLSTRWELPSRLAWSNASLWIWFAGSLNFIKLCKMKYYNLCQFHTIEVGSCSLGCGGFWWRDWNKHRLKLFLWKRARIVL